ncbi:MAG: NADH-quinone oxidoreductase subunit L [Pseudomonadota bacterium]
METIILFSPLVGAVLCGMGWRVTGPVAAQILATVLVALACALSWLLHLSFDGDMRQADILRFVESGVISTDWTMRVDRLTTLMLVLVTSLSTLAHLYAFGGTEEDGAFKEPVNHRPRLAGCLSFATFAMVVLVSADNMVQLIAGLEAVSLSAMLLVAFVFRKPAANSAAITTFVIARIGGVALILASAAVFAATESLMFDVIFEAAPGLLEARLGFLGAEWSAAALIGLALVVAAMAAAAQIFLHTWLPEAMEAPSLAAGLVHCGLMGLAALFLICRFSPFMAFAPEAQAALLIIGGVTAVFAASIAIAQSDLKKALAYAGAAQFGIVFVGLGAGAYTAALHFGIGHAVTILTFFFAAAAVLRAMGDDRNLLHYGGLRLRLPLTFWVSFIAAAGLIGLGVPMTAFGLAGASGKANLAAASLGLGTASGTWAFCLVVLASFCTGILAVRLVVLTFLGAAREKPKHAAAQEAPRVMLVPMLIAAAGVVLVGVLGYGSFLGDGGQVAAYFGLDPAAAADEEAAGWIPGSGPLFVAAGALPGDGPAWAAWAPLIAGLAGAVLSYTLYGIAPDTPKRLAQSQNALYLFFRNRWYFDSIYRAIFVAPAQGAGRVLWLRGDRQAIDGALNGVATGLVPFFTRTTGRWQSGYIVTYAFTMILGLVAIVAWILLR